VGRKIAPPTIYTIGYEGVTQASVVDALRDAGVELLADIRYLPLSRRPGFSKSSLKAAAEEAGIAYRHFKQLGTPAEGREAARRGDPVRAQHQRKGHRQASMPREANAIIVGRGTNQARGNSWGSRGKHGVKR